MNSKTYGVMSDFHSMQIWKGIDRIIEALKKEEVDAFVLNGDLSGENSGAKPEQYLVTILQALGKSGLETYVLPGSSEKVQEFEPILDYFEEKHNNIINTARRQKIENGDHDLVFLPGSDTIPTRVLKKGYVIEDNCKSGLYETDEGGIVRATNIEEDIKKLSTRPEKTIVISHVPAKFSRNNCVDIAEFWEVDQPFRVNNEYVNRGTILTKNTGYTLSKQGAPITLKRTNRGNEILKGLFKEVGITKNITGHFHESVGNANDAKGNPVEEGVFVNNLFYNASYMDRLIAGMVTVNDSKITYESIDLKKLIS